MSWLRHVRFAGPAGKITHRLTSIVLAALALTLFFGGLVARQLELAQGQEAGRANGLLVGGIVLALLAIVAAGGLRRSWGISLGWVVLGLTALSTLFLTPMGIVTLLFGALWVLALVQGGSMEQMTREWIAEHGDVHPDDRPGPSPHNDRARGVVEDPSTERAVWRDSDPTERTVEPAPEPTERTDHREDNT